MANHNTIILKGDLDRRYDEGRPAAGQTIYPGQNIKKTVTGGDPPEVTLHATAGGGGELNIPIEDGLIGRLITTPYVAANGDLVRYFTPRPGDELQLRVAAGAVAIVIDDGLTNDGAGNFKKAAGADVVKAKAIQALDLSGSGTADHIEARVL
jgi:hypothetical protein